MGDDLRLDLALKLRLHLFFLPHVLVEMNKYRVRTVEQVYHTAAVVGKQEVDDEPDQEVLLGLSCHFILPIFAHRLKLHDTEQLMLLEVIFGFSVNLILALFVILIECISEYSGSSVESFHFPHG